MKVGTFFIRVWRLASIAGLVFSVLNCYISYPAEVAVQFNDIGQATQYLDRETLFYISVAIFLVNNTLINSIARLFPRIPTEKVPVPAIWSSNRQELNEIVVNWFYALMAAINTILALALFVLSMLNRSDMSNASMKYVWLMPLSTIILSAVFLSLPVRLLFMKPSPEQA